MILLPVQGQILFSASSENQTEMVKAFSERISKYGEVIHEYLEKSFSKNILSIQRSNVAGVLHNPKGKCLYANVPNGHVNVVFS